MIENKKTFTAQEPTLGRNFRPVYTLPLIGEPAPPFKAKSTKGDINFPLDYKGKWVIFFSYPGDFCATCTTEMIALSQNSEFYEELGVEILAMSIDSLSSHIAWLESIYDLEYDGVSNTKIDFPLISDSNREISMRYGLLRRGEESTETVRGGFVIDPEGKVRAIQVYPRSVGASGDEIRRLVEAIQKSERENVDLPANWMPGDDVLLPVCNTIDGAFDNERRDVVDPNINCAEWYLCFEKDEDANQILKNKNNIHNRIIKRKFDR
jgi:peroxiredoxin (alkyl hydroperoxide reductase subunit C)